MAHRDKSQGFGFVFSSVEEILKHRDNFTASGEWDPITAPTDSQVVNLPQETPPPLPQSATPETEKHKSVTAVERIKENLDRLSKLHQKLHVMLDEIQKAGGPKKKPQ